MMIGVLVAAMALAAASGTAAAATLRLSRRYERYAVEGSSMAPTINPGDWLIVDRQAYGQKDPRPGHVVLAIDPRDPAREIVKRVVNVSPHNEAWLEGDHPSESTDSRQFGPVPRKLVLGRVKWRYWPSPGKVT
jgi:nickel-type superoxide dismutase maturation protease